MKDKKFYRNLDKNIMNKSDKGEKMDRLEDNTIKSNIIINNIETSTNIKEYYVILSILEAYLNMINIQHKIIKRYGITDITQLSLKQLGEIIKFENYFLSNGIMGFCFERLVYDCILTNFDEITNYILDFIVELEGYQYSNFVNVILWGTEKGNSIKNEDLNRSLNLIENDHYIRVGNIYYNFKDKLKFLSHKGNNHSGIGKADLFVNQYGSKRWFGVNVKLNIEDLKMSKTPELPIGIALKTNKFGRQRKALVEHGYTRFDPDYFTYVFQKEKDFGEYFLKYFSDIKEMFSQITKENLNNIKNFYCWSDLLLKIVIEFSNNPISDLLNFLSFQLANENFLPERTIIPNTSLTFLINGYDRSLIEITSPPISTLIVG